jgi:hypothetical protein
MQPISFFPISLFSLFHQVLAINELGLKYLKPKTRQTNAPHQAKFECGANSDLAS